MFSRFSISLSLLFSLILVSAVCVRFGIGNDVVSSQTTPVVPEDEEVKSSNEAEIDKSRLCDLHAMSVDPASCQWVWSQLAIEATHLLQSLPLRIAYPRGPPTV